MAGGTTDKGMGGGGKFPGVDVEIPFPGADDVTITVTFETAIL